MSVGPRQQTLLTAGLGAVITLVVALAPWVPFAYRIPALHIAFETTEALIGLLVAFLVLGRFNQSGYLRDFRIVYALLMLSATNLFFSVVPDLADRIGTQQFATWAPTVTRMIGAVALATAAFTSREHVRERERAVRIALAGCWATLSAVAIVIGLLIPVLPEAIQESSRLTKPFDPRLVGHPALFGHPALLGAQVLGALIFGLAAVGFTYQAERDGDHLMKWFGAGAALAAFARINYFWFPSIYTDYVYVGDVLRLGFYAFLLVGAVLEITSYWQSRAEAAVLEERRRISRNLHDGLAQELTYIWRELRQLDKKDPRIYRLTAASERALDESRRAIASLTRSVSEPLDITVAQAAEDVAHRAGARLRLDLERRIEVAPLVAEEMARVVREAVSNAVRHGDAEHITVRLWRDGVVRLRIEDDGRGFDLGAAGESKSRFGLVSMRERIVALDGQLAIESSPGSGTQIEVTIP